MTCMWFSAWPKWDNSKCSITRRIDFRAFQRNSSIVTLRHNYISFAKSDPLEKPDLVLYSHNTHVSKISSGDLLTIFSDVPRSLFCLLESRHPFQHLTTHQRRISWPSYVFPFSFWWKIHCCYWVFFSPTRGGTQYSLFWTNHFVKRFHKCFQMMGDMGALEPLMGDLGLVIQRLWGLCLWSSLCEAAMQSECRMNLLGPVDPAMIMKHN